MRSKRRSRNGALTLQVRWTHPALIDFLEAQDYIANENPEAARAVAQRIWDGAKQLGTNPKIGRVGTRPGTREWVVARTPYLIVYWIRADVVEVLRVWHGRQQRNP